MMSSLLPVWICLWLLSQWSIVIDSYTIITQSTTCSIVSSSVFQHNTEETVHRRRLLGQRRNGFHLQQRLRSSSTQVKATKLQEDQQQRVHDLPVLPGVPEFESWFRNIEGSQLDPSVIHASFQNGRGLGWKDDSPWTKKTYTIATIPANVVLSSEYDSNKYWDRDLAIQLWKECQKGSVSLIYGYCQLLTRGQDLSDDTVPSSLAPNTVRQWNPLQKQLLQKTNRGQNLLRLEQEQLQDWREKYATVDSIGNVTMSWEQFLWSMETVHSRAFVGIGVRSNLVSPSVLASVVAPIIAAIAGLVYVSTTPVVSESALWTFGLAVALIPSIILYNIPSSKKQAVLLPVIDSANHIESADSCIDYDPIRDNFQLLIGPKCLVNDVVRYNNSYSQPEMTKIQQIYVTYGQKSDTELLLNYGFLPDTIDPNFTTSRDDADDRDDNDVFRKHLAEAFHRRNP